MAELKVEFEDIATGKILYIQLGKWIPTDLPLEDNHPYKIYRHIEISMGPGKDPLIGKIESGELVTLQRFLASDTT